MVRRIPDRCCIIRDYIHQCITGCVFGANWKARTRWRNDSVGLYSTVPWIPRRLDSHAWLPSSWTPSEWRYDWDAAHSLGTNGTYHGIHSRIVGISVRIYDKLDKYMSNIDIIFISTFIHSFIHSFNDYWIWWNNLPIRIKSWFAEIMRCACKNTILQLSNQFRIHWRIHQITSSAVNKFITITITITPSFYLCLRRRISNIHLEIRTNN